MRRTRRLTFWRSLRKSLVGLWTQLGGGRAAPCGSVERLIDRLDERFKVHGAPDFETVGQELAFRRLLRQLESFLVDPANDLDLAACVDFGNLIAELHEAVGPRIHGGERAAKPRVP